MFYLCRLFWCTTRPVYMRFMEGVLCFICVVCFGVLPLHEAHIDRPYRTPKQTTQIKHKTPSIKLI
jgi:hypothetical protein